MGRGGLGKVGMDSVAQLSVPHDGFEVRWAKCDPLKC